MGHFAVLLLVAAGRACSEAAAGFLSDLCPVITGLVSTAATTASGFARLAALAVNRLVLGLVVALRLIVGLGLIDGLGLLGLIVGLQLTGSNRICGTLLQFEMVGFHTGTTPVPPAELVLSAGLADKVLAVVEV